MEKYGKILGKVWKESLINVMLTWTIAITHAFLSVFFEFHENSSQIQSDVMFFVHINVFEIIY